VDALGGAISQPAWRTEPAWSLVSGDDHMIPTPAQRAMAERIGARTVEVAGASQPSSTVGGRSKRVTVGSGLGGGLRRLR
jgi:hypothetical protein